MNENEMMQTEDEVGLFDLWEKLRAGWRLVIAGIAIGVLAAGLVIVVIPPRYEATSTLQIGMLAGKGIEEATTTLERFKSSTFVLEAIQQAGGGNVAERISLGKAVIGDYVKAQLVKGTSLIELKTIGDTPESSIRLNDVVVKHLAERHSALGEPLMDKLKSDIALTREKLKVVEHELADLAPVSNVPTSKDAQFSPVSLLLSLKIQKQSEVFGLRQQLITLESMQIPPATQATQAIEAPFVPIKSASPKASLMLVLGLIGGLVMGGLAVLVKNGWCRAKRARGGAS